MLDYVECCGNCVQWSFVGSDDNSKGYGECSAKEEVLYDEDDCCPMYDSK